MEAKSRTGDLKRIIWAMRIYSLIIIAVLLISGFTSWLSEDTVRLVVMLMALFTFAQSFQPYLAKHRKAAMWAIIGLIVLLLLGIAVFFFAE